MKIKYVETLYNVYYKGELYREKWTLEEVQSICMAYAGYSYRPIVILKRIK